MQDQNDDNTMLIKNLENLSREATGKQPDQTISWQHQPDRAPKIIIRKIYYKGS